MANPAKRKGYAGEKELQEKLEDAGLEDVMRPWGSDGRSAGLPPGADLQGGGILWQVKRRKRVSAIYCPPNEVDVTAFREDRGDWFVSLRLSDFLRLVKEADGW